jgi:hypothetical protein
MARRFTNRDLQRLLTELGFRPADSEQNQRQWRHLQSGCVLLLPANKLDEAPRPADLVGVRAHLDLQGHLDESTFDDFVTSGKLPAAVTDGEPGN